MVIIDQEQTILNFSQMLGIRVMPNAARWSVVALLDMKGATIALGTYQAQEMAESVRDQILSALSLGKNVLEMPPEEMKLPIEFGDPENA